MELNDFRPISLVGCVYKIVAKVLAKRVKVVLGKIIDESQSAFVGGRSMLDSVVTINEVIDDAKRLKKKCVVFKVDFKKAYDSGSWNFLVYMMQKLGF